MVLQYTLQLIKCQSLGVSLVTTCQLNMNESICIFKYIYIYILYVYIYYVMKYNILVIMCIYTWATNQNLSRALCTLKFGEWWWWVHYHCTGRMWKTLVQPFLFTTVRGFHICRTLPPNTTKFMYILLKYLPLSLPSLVSILSFCGRYAKK